MPDRDLTDFASVIDFTPDQNPDVLRASHKALSRQLPLMYITLLINMWALAITHAGVAPAYLTFVVPAVFTILVSIRVVRWLAASGKEYTTRQIRKQFTLVKVLAVVIAVVFSAWALALYFYGEGELKAHVGFFMAITVIACILSLMHLPAAALTVAAIVDFGIVSFFMFSGNAVFIAMAANVLLVTVVLLFILNNNYKNFVAHIHARQKTEQLSRENFQIANVDSLTGLPNRRQFFSRLSQYVTESSNCGERLALALIDLDGFKPINDFHGHSTGDALLVKVGERVLDVIGDEGFFARLGGDEFAVLISGGKSDPELQELGGRITEALEMPFSIYGLSLNVSASIGIATYPDQVSDEHDLFDSADFALYDAKERKPGRTILFSTEHSTEIRMNAAIERALKSGIAEVRLSTVFQPIIDVQTGLPVAFEALARWNCPEFGPIPPSRFVQVAERTGQVNKMTCILLVKALEEAAKWPSNVGLSFNLSPHDISSPEAVNKILGIVLKSGVDPRRLEFEITESALFKDPAQAMESAELIRSFGIGLSLDDFGTGHSSLVRLHALPFSKIKIDRSFVSGLQAHSSAYKIIRSLVALADDMKLGYIVEGVETAGELEQVVKLGCRYVQGYYFSKPMAAADAAEFADASCISDRIRA